MVLVSISGCKALTKRVIPDCTGIYPPPLLSQSRIQFTTDHTNVIIVLYLRVNLHPTSIRVLG